MGARSGAALAAGLSYRSRNTLQRRTFASRARAAEAAVAGTCSYNANYSAHGNDPSLRLMESGGWPPLNRAAISAGSAAIRRRKRIRRYGTGQNFSRSSGPFHETNGFSEKGAARKGDQRAYQHSIEAACAIGGSTLLFSLDNPCFNATADGLIPDFRCQNWDKRPDFVDPGFLSRWGRDGLSSRPRRCRWTPPHIDASSPNSELSLPLRPDRISSPGVRFPGRREALARLVCTH